MEELKNHADRAHAVLSASSAHRWLNCPPSAVAALAYEDTGSEFAAEGTMAHEVAEAIASGRTVQRSESLTAEMIDCARGYAEYIDELKTGDDAVVLLEQRVDFSPWVPDGFGTCDCLIIQGDTLAVVDYKHGVGVPVSAENNPQMMLYALGALNDYGFAYEVTKVQMHIYQPRINNISAYTVTVDELTAWAEETVRPTAEKAAKGKGNYNAGAWCKFCPHAGRCRKLTAACREFVEAHNLRASVPMLAPFEVAEVLEMEPLISLWLKRVKAQALDTLLDGGEVPGFKAVEGRSTRAWADELRVVEVLIDAGYGPEDYLESKLHSPAGMDGVIGKKKAAELLGGLIVKKPGSPSVVPSSDRREPITRLETAKKDFE